MDFFTVANFCGRAPAGRSEPLFNCQVVTVDDQPVRGYSGAVVTPTCKRGDFEPDLIVAVAVGPSLYAAPPEHSGRIPPMLQAHNDALRILMAAQTERTIERFRQGPTPLVLVRPSLEQQATFAVGSVVRYIEEGYRAATRALHEFLGAS